MNNISNENFLILQQLLDEKQTASLLGLTPRAMQNFRYRGSGPPYVKISNRCVRYRMEDILQFIDERTCTSTSDDAVSHKSDCAKPEETNLGER